MGTSRLAAIVSILILVSIGWFALGSSVWSRTESLDDTLSAEMRSLWGPETLAQNSPTFQAMAGEEYLFEDGIFPPTSSDITADIRHEHRDKGLLWYSTFTVDFRGRYTIAPAEADQPTKGEFVFPLPAMVASYNNLSLNVDGNAMAVTQADVLSGELRIPLDRNSEHAIDVAYSTGGQNRWLYVPGKSKTTKLRSGAEGVYRGTLCKLSSFSLTATTNFGEIDYPAGSRSPSTPATTTTNGMTANWTYEHAMTSQPMGIEMPTRTNAGPIAARMSFFAPVSLAFFFTVLFTVVVLKKIPLHPMHYLFVALGFFAFHILLAYLADVMAIQPAFWVATGVSVLLVTSYMRLVAGMKFTLAYVGLSQLVFLIGFSYAFFWVGRTGLTITVGAVLTLFVLMQATGRVDWTEVLAKPAPPKPPRIKAAQANAGD